MEDSVMVQKASPEELLGMVREFEDAEHATREARILAQRDRDYYDEKQWTPEEVAALERRGQPAITSNRIKRKVNSLMGLEKQARKDPKAFPRNPDDQQAADAATDTIRYVCEDSRWDDKRSQCAKELAVEGTCAVMIGVKKIKAGIDPDIRRVAWDRFYYDPASSEFDFADSAFMGVVIWMDLDDAVRKYPEAEDALTATWAKAHDSDTYDDKPKHGFWADYKRKRVRICEHYYKRGGVWMFCMFTQAGYVVEPQESPYEGEDGPECPIKAVSLYVDRDNNRYGEVRTMIGPQDMINKTDSKYMHLISQRQVRVSPNVAQDAAVVRKELSRPDGVFIGDPGDVEILPTNDMAMANFQMNQSAKAEIDMLGPNAAMGGKNEQALSGRAVIAQQQGGMTEAATYLDCIKTLSLAVYRSVWCRIRQHWKEERWVRVTDNEQNLRFVGMNKQITALQKISEQMGVTKENLPQLQQAAQAGDPQAVQMLQQLQQLAQDPRSQQVVEVENNVAELDVDIIVDEGIDTPTVAAEQFDTLAKMIPALGAVGQAPWVVEMLIQASSLRNKDALLDKMKETQEAAQGQPDPAQAQMQAEAQAAQQQAQMDAQLAQEKAQLDAQAKVEVAKIAAAADIEVAEIKAQADAEIAAHRLALDGFSAGHKMMADELRQGAA